LPASDPGLRRVSVHAGTAVVDLSLPAGVPVAVLVPSIVDIMKGRGVGGSSDLEAGRYQLSRPGASPLATSTTLAQNDIRDGAVLVLTRSTTPQPAPRHDDIAEAVSATLEAAARPRRHSRRTTRLTGAVAAGSLTAVGVLVLIRNAFRVSATGSAASVAASAGLVALFFATIAHRTYRDAIAGLALSVIAIGFAAVAGFLAVPGGPGIHNALLAATAAAVISVLAMRVSGCGGVTLTAVSSVAMFIAVAALVGVITAAPLRAIGSVSALMSLGLLGVVTRVSIVLAGLSPRLPPAPEVDTIEPEGAWLAAKAIRADEWSASLLAAFSSSATVGAVVTVLAGAPRLCCLAFGMVTGALLLLRARSVDDSRRTLVFVTGGMLVTATTFGVAALSMPGNGAWIAAATALLATAAIFLGFVAPAISLSPVVRRTVEVLECLALVATAPLTGWICGLYSAVRGLHL
jgi:type VII secretion integral membrane protein EccD